RCPSPSMESGQAAVLSGVVEQGVIFLQDDTHFRCMHYATSQSSIPSWVYTFPQHVFQGDATHQGQRRPWLTPKNSSGPWSTRRDYRSSGTLCPCHRTGFTAHTWSARPQRDPKCSVSQILLWFSGSR